MDMPQYHENCLFCNIAQKHIPATIAYDDGQVIAFHDIKPQAPTHLLIIPSKHIATLNELDDTTDTLLAGQLMQVAKHLAKEYGIAESGYRTVMNCNTDGGQEVYHIHLHLLGGRHLHWPPG